MLLLVSGCQNNTDESLSFDEQEAIVEEIKRTIDDYADANVRRDLDDISRFWSEGSLTFVGDGAVPGGSDEWSAQVRRSDEGTDRWLNWEWQNVHVEVMSMDAARCTLEFEVTKTTVDGDTLNIRGAATYVFRNYDGNWRLTETTGTLAEF